MTDKKKVDITIHGRNFTVIGNESDDYIKNLADFVDNKIKDVTGKNDKLSYSMAVTLTAFNIADEYYRTSVELAELQKRMKGPMEQYESLKESLRKAEETIAQLEKECREYRSDFLETKTKEEKNSKVIKKQEQALELKERELKENEKIIKELQDKLFENQMELIQTKKELEEAIKDIDREKGIFAKEEN